MTKCMGLLRSMTPSRLASGSSAVTKWAADSSTTPKSNLLSAMLVQRWGRRAGIEYKQLKAWMLPERGTDQAQEQANCRRRSIKSIGLFWEVNATQRSVSSSPRLLLIEQQLPPVIQPEAGPLIAVLSISLHLAKLQCSSPNQTVGGSQWHPPVPGA